MKLEGTNKNINVIKLNLLVVNFNLIIVRYGEIALKGKAVRKRFEDVLITNIKNALKMNNISSKIEKEWGRIYICIDNVKESIDILRKIFGIISISPALQTKSDMNSISKLSLKISKNKINEKKSFAIRTTRTGIHDFSSQDVSIKIGEDIVKKTNAKVNLTTPDFELFIEIRNDKAYLFTEKIRCIGGMPIGSQGNILAILDSKSSILASWYLMKRGCKISFLVIKKTNLDVLKSFLNYWFVKPNYMFVGSKDKLKNKIKIITEKNNFNAIVTSHTIYDSSKNALSEIKQLKKHINLPILNPLISMNQEEINKKCMEIGLQI